MLPPGRAATPTGRLVAWTGAGLFVLSLGYFLQSFWTRFGIASSDQVHMADLLWNVGLFSAFALHHSVFARLPIREWLRRVFPTLERSIYVWIASVLFIIVCWQWRPLGGVLWDVDGPARVASFLGQLAGIAISVRGAAALDIWELAGVQQLASRQDSVDDFSTKGLYGVVRHPIYMGWFLLVFSVGTMTMTRFVFASVSCAYVLLAIPFEERSLRKSSHGAYDRYIQRVPKKLIPGLY